MKRQTWYRQLVIICLGMGLFNSCLEPSSPPANTLVFGKAREAVTLDPANVTEGESASVVVNIFDTLVRFEKNSTTIRPWLAKSWKVSHDKLTWTFYLQQGIRFHDGSPLDAHAVKFNYDRQKDPQHPYRFKGQFEYWQLFNSVKGIWAPDPYTVVFTLNRPDAVFLSNLAIFSMGVSSPQAIRKFGADYERHPVGSGPFVFERWDTNRQIVLRRNPSYWAGPALMERVIFKPIPDNYIRLLELEYKTIHIMDGVDPSEVNRIKYNPELTLLTQPGLNVGYLALNNRHKPFGNLKVRLALNHAINKQRLVKDFFANGELGQAAKNPLPPTVWSYNDQIEDYPYDPAKARQLLTEAGFPQGFKTRLWVMPVPRPYMPQPNQIGEAIQADLKRVGIDAEIVSYEWGEYLERLAQGEHDMALIGWFGDNGDPDNFLYTLFDKDNTTLGKASNYAFYQGEKVHQLLIKAQQLYNQEQRANLYRQAQVLIHNDAPWVPLFHSTQVVATLKKIKGFALHPVADKYFRYVEHEP